MKNSGHDYLHLDFFGQNRNSRIERGKNFRIPDYLLLNEDFKDLLNSKIRKILENKISECKLLRQHQKKQECFQRPESDTQEK